LNDVIRNDVKKVSEDVDRDFFRGKNILITGGAGFIGSWLADVLITIGSNVVCLDNFSTGLYKNVAHLLNKDGFKLLKGDITNGVPSGDYDYIFHLASRASPDEYQLNPIETMLANSIGSYNVLEYCRKKDIPVLFSSTSEVYGDAEVIPTPETYWGKVNPIGPRSCYDESKRFAEALFMAFFRKYGLDVKIVRIFNTYGPRLRFDGIYGRVVSKFISQALQGEPLTVYGDGMQTRSFTYISDTLIGLMKVACSQFKGEVFNIGSQDEITILELAKTIIELTGSKSKIKYLPLPKDDPRRRCPDISKAKKLLNWEAKTSLKDGLGKTLQWFTQDQQ